MENYLTHFYSSDTGPFQSLSALPDEEALQIMRELCDDTPFGERFKDPVQYLTDRKATEQWVRESFIEKGGKPRDAYPIPMALGSSEWLDKAAPDPEKHRKILIPLTEFTEYDVSFTYPDSMVSHWFGHDKPADLYQAGLHGIVFTLPEIRSLVNQKGMPEEDWEFRMPEQFGSYIEAQVWNHQLLFDFLEKMKQQQPGDRE